MKCTITLTRSDKWIATERLTTGDNVPTYMDVEVTVSELSEPNRARLLAYGCGTYPATLPAIQLSNRNEPNRMAGYGREKFMFDGYTATAAEIDVAISAAYDRIATDRAEAERRQAERTAEEAASKARREEKQAAIAAARELLAYELEQGQQCEKDRQILSEFLAAVPQDALRGTLRRLAGEVDAADELQKRVEDASPELIFDDEDSDEDSDD